MNKKKIFLIFFLLVIWVLITLVILGFVKEQVISGKKNSEKNRVYEVKESITIESGEVLPLGKDYFKGDAPEGITIEYYSKNVQLADKEGKFYYKDRDKKIAMGAMELEVVLKADNDKTYRSKLTITDKTKPKVVLKDLEVEAYSKYEAKDFIEEYTDNSHIDEYDATFIDEVVTEVGKYELKLKICDKSKNCVEKTGKLEIVPGKLYIKEYTLDYGMYSGKICDENVDEEHCVRSNIYLKGDSITLTDNTVKKYYVDGYHLILTNGEVFTVIGDNELELQNSLKSVYKYREESLS